MMTYLPNATLTRRIRWGGVILGLGVIIGLSFAGQLYLYRGLGLQPISWRGAIRWEITRWTLLAVSAWAALLLIQRYRIERQNWKRRLFIHTLSSLLFSFLHLCLFSFLYWLIVLPADKPLLEVFRVFEMGLYRDSHMNLVVYWVILLVDHALAYRRRNARLEAQLAQAQLHALKMQLHPHFLFNTLNSIAALLRQDVKAADEMLVGLGDFLRLTLENSGAQEVTVREEIEFLRRYLEIERIRFQGRLTTHFEIEPQTLAAQAPYLILQPIVENAIKHGLASRVTPGRLEIRAERHNGRPQMLSLTLIPAIDSIRQSQH